MLFLFVLILILALLIELWFGYSFKKQMRPRIKRLPEYRELEAEARNISLRQNEQASVVVDWDGFTATLGIRTGSQGRRFARKNLQQYYLLVLDRQTLTVRSVASLQERT